MELQRLTFAHMQAVLAFELENRAYFAQSINDRGDEFFLKFPEHHRAQLVEQDAGVCVFHVLVDGDATVVGRFNLYGLTDGTATVGYRVAQSVAGHGVATRSLRELCRVAVAECGLRTLTAEVADTNHASRRVLEKTGFVPVTACMVAGRPGVRSTLDLDLDLADAE